MEEDRTIVKPQVEHEGQYRIMHTDGFVTQQLQGVIHEYELVLWLDYYKSVYEHIGGTVFAVEDITVLHNGKKIA